MSVHLVCLSCIFLYWMSQKWPERLKVQLKVQHEHFSTNTAFQTHRLCLSGANRDEGESPSA